MTFLEIASAAVARGLNIIPLKAKDKAPFQPDWVNQATNSMPVIEGWNSQNPEYNCGAVTNKDTYWILDVDCMSWWMDNFPVELLPIKTYSVLTGGGGRHYYFLHDEESRKNPGKVSLANPDVIRWKKPDGSECKNVIDVLGHNTQVLVAGCIHPKSGKPYEVYTDLPLSTCPPALMQWLRTKLAEKKKQVNPTSAEKNPFEVVKGWDPDACFLGTGLIFAKSVKDGQTFYNYHALMGKCLVKGDKHIGDGGSNENNNECSAFVWNPDNRQLWHKCQASACDSIGKRTAINKALAGIGVDWKNVFQSSGDGIVTSYAKVTWASEIKAEHMEWLWPGYLPANKLLTFVGSSTQGKSPVTLDLAARCSRGLDWPNGAKNERGPMKVIVLAAEDDWNDTVLPRLMLAGADCSKVGQLNMVTAKDQEETAKATKLDTDFEAIAKAIREIGGVGLVIIDPVTNYLGKVKMNAEDEVRSLMMPLAILAQEQKICIIIVCHTNKRSDTTSPQQRVMGAAGFVGVARGHFYFDSDKDDEDKFSHVMIIDRIKADSMKYKTVGDKLSWPDADGNLRESEVVRVVWGGTSDSTGDDFGKNPSTKVKSEMAEAATVLKTFLAKGVKKSVMECCEFLKQAGYEVQSGHGQTGLNSTRLCKKAGVVKTSDKGRWFWSIPDTTTLNDEPIPEQGDMGFDPADFMDKEEL